MLLPKKGCDKLNRIAFGCCRQYIDCNLSDKTLEKPLEVLQEVLYLYHLSLSFPRNLYSESSLLNSSKTIINFLHLQLELLLKLMVEFRYCH
jgi:hypothetical protein